MTLNLHGLTEAEAQAILDKAAPKEVEPGEQLWALLNTGVGTCWALAGEAARDRYRNAAARLLRDYVKRSKIEAVLLECEDAFGCGFITNTIREAMGGE